MTFILIFRILSSSNTGVIKNINKKNALPRLGVFSFVFFVRSCTAGFFFCGNAADFFCLRQRRWFLSTDTTNAPRPAAAARYYSQKPCFGNRCNASVCEILGFLRISCCAAAAGRGGLCSLTLQNPQKNTPPLHRRISLIKFYHRNYFPYRQFSAKISSSVISFRDFSMYS